MIRPSLHDETKLMDAASEERIRIDYLNWTGGFEPESEEQVTLYLEASCPFNVDYDDAFNFLREWMKRSQSRNAS